MNPVDIANKAYEQFEKDSRRLTDEDYIQALEELICSLESSLNAKKEELDQ
jgi:hypothetical protein